jgi:hypothetical protein
MSILVVFFGGYKASKSDMKLWLDSARKQRDDVKFEACPYPDIEGASEAAAVAGFKKQVGFDVVIKIIEDSGADTLFIVGHSSGCAIANELNSLIKEDKYHITLIDLDGFAPQPDQRKKSTVEAWTADGDSGKKHSLWWASNKKMSHAIHATNKYSLHFSLVNKAATDDITNLSLDDLKKGYAGCIANLDWLPPKNR